MRTRTLSALAWLLALATPIFAAGPGATGADVLRFASSPRSFSMAEAMTAVADGPASLSANPAALSAMPYRELDLSYTRWVEDIGYQSILYGQRSPFGTLGLSLLRRDVGGLQGYDAGGQLADKISAEDLVFGVGLGRPILNSGTLGVSLGAGFKGIESRLEKARARGYAVDVGGLADLDLSWAKISAGAAVQNIGAGLKYDRENTPLPTTYRLGLAAQRRVYGDPFTLALDLVKSRADPGRLKIGVGFEGGVSGVLFPRIGFRMPDDLGNGLFFGLGLKVKGMRLDYGLALLGAFGPAHRFGLSLKWGEPIEVSRTQENLDLAASHRKLGQAFMRQGRYLEAVQEYSQALKFDPTNEEILRELKGASDAMH